MDIDFLHWLTDETERANAQLQRLRHGSPQWIMLMNRITVLDECLNRYHSHRPYEERRRQSF